jgi:ferritin
MNKKIEDAFNEQINAELFSAYLYLSMAAHFESVGLKGFASWMRVQVQEEQSHADKFFDFINDRGGRVVLKAIEGPKTHWDAPLNVFEETLEHEKKISGLIDKLVDLAMEERNHAAHTFLQWFVTEQVEEEATAQEIIDKLKMASDPSTLFQLDKDLGARTFTPPADAT